MYKLHVNLAVTLLVALNITLEFFALYNANVVLIAKDLLHYYRRRSLCNVLAKQLL